MLVPPTKKPVYCTHAWFIYDCLFGTNVETQDRRFQGLFVSRRKANRVRGVTDTDHSSAVGMRAVEACRLIY